MKVRIISNGCGDTIVAAEIERRGRKDYVPAENWRELESAARDHLASHGVPVSETGIFDCPQQLAEKAKFGFELFWAQTGLPLGEAFAAWRREVLGANDYAVLAIQHGVSPRTLQLFEQQNHVPRRVDTRRRLERVYWLPEGFLDGLVDE